MQMNTQFIWELHPTYKQYDSLVPLWITFSKVFFFIFLKQKKQSDNLEVIQCANASYAYCVLHLYSSHNLLMAVLSLLPMRFK